MKSPITWLPTLMMLALALAFISHAPATSTAVSGTTHNGEIHELQQQVKTLSERLDRLEAQNHHVVPRGGLGPAGR